MKKLLQILSSLVGIVFLLSGIGKSLIAYEFSEILMQYGFDALRYFAPLIIVVEIILGLLLFFQIRQKSTSLLALCFVLILSLAYLYGYFIANVTDCGCFGYFSLLNLSPLFTFLRNFILICLLLYVFFKSDNIRKPTDKNEVIVIVCILCAVCFITGYTYVEHSNDNSTQYVTEGKSVNVDVDNSALSEFVMFSKDSTYLVFAFSYSCPHCYNSIENLKQYERLGIADKVIGLTFANDSIAIEKFNDLFEPNFPIVSAKPEQLFRLTNRFPVSYYVENNTVKMEIRGVLPSGYILQRQLNKR